MEFDSLCMRMCGVWQHAACLEVLQQPEASGLAGKWRCWARAHVREMRCNPQELSAWQCRVALPISVLSRSQQHRAQRAVHTTPGGTSRWRHGGAPSCQAPPVQ